MDDKHLLIYHNIVHKYQLNIIKLDYNYINNEFDNIINKLIIKNDVNNNLYKYRKNTDYVVYVNNRLINFLYENDYEIDNILFYRKLYNKILIMSDLYRFIRVKKIDDEIFNDIKNISESNYFNKKILIKNFISKYSTTSEPINIVI